MDSFYTGATVDTYYVDLEIYGLAIVFSLRHVFVPIIVVCLVVNSYTSDKVDSIICILAHPKLYSYTMIALLGEISIGTTAMECRFRLPFFSMKLFLTRTNDKRTVTALDFTT